MPLIVSTGSETFELDISLSKLSDGTKEIRASTSVLVATQSSISFELAADDVPFGNFKVTHKSTHLIEEVSHILLLRNQ